MRDDIQSSPAISCTQPSGHHVYEEKRACALGGEEFTALYLGTHSTYGTFLDLGHVSYLQFPIAVPVCPNSGFVDYKDEYTSGELAVFAQVVATEQYRELLGKHTSWHLFARMMEMASVDPDNDWWRHNQAAIEAKNCGLDQFPDYARLAIKAADARLISSGLDDPDLIWGLKLSRLDFMRQMGDFRAAQEGISTYGEIPEQYRLAFNTLQEAIQLESTDRVPIGEYERQRQAAEIEPTE